MRKPVRQKKQVFFARCGSLRVRNFTGKIGQVKSDPDVFADALVSQAGRWLAFRISLSVIYLS